MTTLAPAPDWAPRVWQDGSSIYIQFPSGLVQRFAFTEGGLSRALKLIPKVQDQAGYLSGGQNIFDRVAKPKIIKIGRGKRARRVVSNLSEDDKRKIDDLIKTLDIKEKR